MDFRSAVGGAARTALCQLLDIPDAIDGLVDFDVPGLPALGAIDDFSDGARRGARNLLCPSPDDNPFPPGLPNPVVPPAPGGQCPGVRYDVVYEVDFPNPQNPVTGIIGGFQNLLGPIEGIRVDNFGTTSQVVVTANGQDEFGIVETSSAANYTNPRFTSITRTDGSPDECPENTPPPPFIEDPFPYDPPEGPPITITPTITFGPFNIGSNNTVIAPVTVVDTDFNLGLNININTGDITFDFGDGDPNGEKCCLPPVIEVPPPPDPEPDPEPDSDVRIVGVIVTATTVPPTSGATVVGGGTGPDKYFPDIGLVQFRVRVNGVEAWLPPIKIQNRRQLIQCPWPEGAIRVSVDPRPGVGLTGTEVFARVPLLNT